MKSLVQKPEKRWNVGEPSVQPRSVDEDQPRPETQSVPRPVEEQPSPTVRVGGSSGSGTDPE